MTFGVSRTSSKSSLCRSRTPGTDRALDGWQPHNAIRTVSPPKRTRCTRPDRQAQRQLAGTTTPKLTGPGCWSRRWPRRSSGRARGRSATRTATRPTCGYASRWLLQKYVNGSPTRRAPGHGRRNPVGALDLTSCSSHGVGLRSSRVPAVGSPAGQRPTCGRTGDQEEHRWTLRKAAA
jgi:hypothetical protein